MNLSLPTNEVSERAFAGACLVEPKLIDHFPGITKGMFSDDLCGSLVEMIRDLRDTGKPVDDRIVIAESQRRKLGLKQAIQEFIYDGRLQVAHVAYHAGAVREAHERREVISAAQDAITDAHNNAVDVQEISSTAIAKMESLGAVDNQFVFSMDQVGEQHFDSIFAADDDRRAVPTSIDIVDAKLGGGFYPGQSIILAALPGGGKSAMALQIADNAATTGSHVLFVSLEMEAVELSERMVARRTGVSVDSQRNRNFGTDSGARVRSAISEVAKMSDRFQVFTPPTATVRQIRAEARMLQARSQVDLIVVDYLQLLRAEGRHSNANAAVTEISKSLKALAREIQVPVLTLSQFNRTAATGDRPRLSQLRDSGSIEQDANVAILLHKINPNNPTCEKIEFIIAKRRNGSQTVVNLLFEGKRFHFTEPSRSEF